MAKGSRDTSRYPNLSNKRKGFIKARMRLLINKRWKKNLENNAASENCTQHVNRNSIAFRSQFNENGLPEIGCNFLDMNGSIYTNEQNIESTTSQDDEQEVAGPSANNEICVSDVPDNELSQVETVSDFFPTGRRIIDVGHWFKTLMNHKHVDLFKCSFVDMKIIKEKRIGLRSTFTLQCKICKINLELDTDSIDSEILDVNMAAVSACISTGNGWTQLSEVVGVLNIPPMSRDMFGKYQKSLFETVKETAWLSMQEAGREEAELATQNGEVDEYGIPLITVIADGAWSKRSYRANYNALSGVACIIGQKTGKILFIGVRNKYCCICARAASLSVECPPHTCYRNHDGPSTAMESEIIVEGFKCSMEMHGIKYAKLVGDGDSSVHRKLLEARPYGYKLIVEKVECSNHLFRNFCTKLKELSQKRFSSSGKLVDIFLRNVLNNNIKRLRIAAEHAAKYRRKNVMNLDEACSNLKKDLINAPSHIFGEHKNCSEIGYFCTENMATGNNLVIITKMRECGLYQDILSCTNRLVYNAKSLLLNMTNNAAETYNSVVAKFIGAKRINFSKRFSYNLRCNAAALSYNTKGRMHYVIHKSLTKHSPGQHTKAFIACQEKQRFRKVPGKVRRRLQLATPADENYGPNAAQTLEGRDMSPTRFDEARNKFLESLKKNETECTRLERNTIGQSSNALWQSERLKRITASNFGKVCKMRISTNCAATVKSLLYNNFRGNRCTKYSIEKEPLAITQFETEFGMRVEQCGLFVDQKDCHLAASPDGLIGADAIVEVKCPVVASTLTPQDAIKQKKVVFASYDDDIFKLKRSHNYHYQVQGQLHITNRIKYYFIFWTPLGMLVEEIYRDHDFWESKMSKQLNMFYFDCLLPEIIDPRFPNLPIRNPEYRKKN